MKQELRTVAIDLAKKIFHLVGADTPGKILWRKRLTRNALMPFMARLPPVLIGLEACGGAHYWARRFREHGHEVKLLAPQFVKPFVKSNKNDMRDAEAIAEAMTRPTMRFIPIKEVDQQDIPLNLSLFVEDQSGPGIGQTLPLLALLATVGSNAACKISSACSNAF
jgi:transposase